MKKFFLVIIAIELVFLIAAVDHHGTKNGYELKINGHKLERIASELEYLSDHNGEGME